ncbi:MAG TPA: hypothetical protein DEH78_09475 [Solibacterales bacterium]|nr:hypothetical protein [Bryobacterales bacterium]
MGRMLRYLIAGWLLMTGAMSAVERFDFVELAVNAAATAGNPFTERRITGRFWREGAGAPVEVEGFCDALDGSVYRVRFMPREAGKYRYEVTLDGAAPQRGTFTVTVGKRKGPVRVDAKYPWHFVYEGTGEHYFWNSTTTYALMGWKDDAQIVRILDRLQKHGINRIRAAIVPPRGS